MASALLSSREILTEVYKLFEKGSYCLHVMPTYIRIYDAKCATELSYLTEHIVITASGIGRENHFNLC
jgi:hypothetical protein